MSKDFCADCTIIQFVCSSRKAKIHPCRTCTAGMHASFQTALSSHFFQGIQIAGQPGLCPRIHFPEAFDQAILLRILRNRKVIRLNEFLIFRSRKKVHRVHVKTMTNDHNLIGRRICAFSSPVADRTLGNPRGLGKFFLGKFLFFHSLEDSLTDRHTTISSILIFFNLSTYLIY